MITFVAFFSVLALVGAGLCAVADHFEGQGKGNNQRTGEA
jgi:hypothetical protein